MNLSFVKLFSKRPSRASRVPHAVSARRLLGAAALAVWALAALPGHAQDPSSDSDDNSVSIPDALGAQTPEDQKNLPDIALSSQIVFQVLAAEVALQRDQPAPAYQTYLALARDTHDPRMAQRATEIALAAQSPSDALAAAQLWQQYAPSSERAAQLDAWRTIQRAHAIANGVYVAVVNRVGYEGKPESGDPGLEFWGNSFVADPFGQVVSQASDDKEEILVVECDPAKSEDTRRNWPFLRDRRIDAYQPITSRWLGE